VHRPTGCLVLAGPAEATVLLSNHGIVSWADTLTHAEWLAEILDTYCHTLMAARQLGLSPRFLTTTQIEPLLELKKRLGLPDIRIQPGSRYRAPRS
jgi:L-fuculose-phosphate aldolase